MKTLILWYESNGTIILYQIVKNMPICIGSMAQLSTNPHFCFDQIKEYVTKAGFDLKTTDIWKI